MGCNASASPQEQVAMDAKQSNGQKTESTKRKSSCPQSFHDNYLLGPKVGRGAFAQVRLTTKARPGEYTQVPTSYPQAVKIIDLRDKVDPGEINKSQQRAVQSEASVWKEVGHNPYCINLFDAFWGECLCYFVMERCKSDLLSALQNESDLNERVLAGYMYEMALGIAHVHSVGIVHRDIKPDNFLVGGPEGKTVKLGDFGLSALAPKSGTLRGVFGTAPFMCPEMLGSRPYDEKADVWSYAVIVYVFLFGTFPYMPKEQSSKGMKEAILNGKPSPRFEPSSRCGKSPRSENAMQYVQAALIREPAQRPTATDLLQMPFMLQASKAPGAAPWPEELPSLRPMLHAAKKVGAFENRDVSNNSSVDHLLQKLQMKSQNLSLPSSAKPDRGSSRPDRERGDESRSTKNSDQYAKKNLPGGVSAHTSGDPDNWDTSSTRSSNGTGRSEDFTFKGSGWSKGTSHISTPPGHGSVTTSNPLRASGSPVAM